MDTPATRLRVVPRTLAVVRGRVNDRAGDPLADADVSVLGRPELGSTESRADGRFDLAVNGGGRLVVELALDGYLPAQRTAVVPWGDFVQLDDVALVPLDRQTGVVDLAAGVSQVAQSSVSDDEAGARQAAVLFPPGTLATYHRAEDGAEVPLDTLTVRITEYTVGPRGPAAMPAPLPPTSAYTYAIELSVDEARADGAKVGGKDVLFDQPVPLYVDNFLHFPVGGAVPVGYYDNDRAAWVPWDNGLIVEVLGDLDADGLTELDLSGDGQPADDVVLAALGIDDAEREALTPLHPAGTSLWRVSLTHFSTWDCNWPFAPPNDGRRPT